MIKLLYLIHTSAKTFGEKDTTTIYRKDFNIERIRKL